MAVAVKDTPETASRQANRLAVGSLAGTVYVLLGIIVAFFVIPQLWTMTVSQWIAGGRGQESVVDKSLLTLVVLAIVAGAIMLGRRLVGTSPPHGLRAGIFVGVLGTVLIGLITSGIGG